MNYKLGLKPVKVQPRLRLAAYATSDLPTADDLTYPFGHSDLVAPQMFLNDQIGDCAIAGSIEEIRLLNASRGVTVNFTDTEARENYSAITGYDGSPETDQGTDVHDLFEYRKNTGIVDADGQRHKVIAYAGLTPGDFDELLVALSRFMVVGIGLQVTDYMEAQFEAGQPWSLLPGRHRIVGGHYVPVVDAPSRTAAGLFTWGGHGSLTADLYRALNTVAVVAITEEMFTDGKTLDGFDRDRLAADLSLVNTGPVMSRRARRAAAEDKAENAEGEQLV